MVGVVARCPTHGIVCSVCYRKQWRWGGPTMIKPQCPQGKGAGCWVPWAHARGRVQGVGCPGRTPGEGYWVLGALGTRQPAGCLSHQTLRDQRNTSSAMSLCTSVCRASWCELLGFAQLVSAKTNTTFQVNQFEVEGKWFCLLSMSLRPSLDLWPILPVRIGLGWIRVPRPALSYECFT